MNPLAELRYFVVALGYFTRVPVPRAISGQAVDLAHAARYFPLVGVCVGALARSGIVLMQSPTSRCAPGNSAGRPATVTP